MTRSEQIAHAIVANCERYHAHAIDYAAWDAEQRRLWDMAKRRGCNWAVCRALTPAFSQSDALTQPTAA